MADRYFVENPILGSAALLVGSDSHHLAHVLRAKPGDEVILFDGSGAEFSARVERVGRAEIELSIVARHAIDRELRVPITLGVALPKGDRQRWLVEKSVELGVSRLVPLHTERSNDRESPAALARLRRAVVEASKQCGRNRLMEIAEPVRLTEFLAAHCAGGLRLIAVPGGEDWRSALETLLPSTTTPAAIHLAIGPEGGFTTSELDAARANGWHALDLGPRTLRVETAALALVAVVVARADQGHA